MNEELAVRLRPLGRLDLLAEVNGKVEEYFRAESEGTANAGSLEREARFYQNAAAIQRELGNLPQAERLATTSLDLFQRLNRQQPASNASRCDRAELRLLLFRIARLSGRDREAEVHGQAAQQLLETARRAEPGDRRASVALAEVLMETGSLWLDRKNRTRADEGFVQAAALLQEVLQGEPDDPEAKRLLAETHYHRGLACQRSDQPAAALEQFTAFLSELKEAGNPGAPDRRRQYELAVAYGRVGEALYGLKQEAAALENFQQFHRLAGDLVEHDPANVLWQQAWAQSLAWLGLLARSQPEESALAGDYLRQAREVYLRLVAHNPNWESWQVHLARLDQELASWHDSRGEVEAAEQVLTSAVTSRLQSARLRPDDFQRYHRLGDALLALAQHHHEHQGLAAAQLFLSEAMTMLPAEFAGAGSEGWWRWPLSRLHATRAHFLYLGGEWSAGLQELNRALDLRQALLEVAADTPQVRQAIPNTFYWITEFHRAAQDLPGAVASAERALDWAAAQLPTDEGRNDLAALCLLLVRPDLQADTRLHARARHLWERCLEERFRDPAPQSPGEVELADRLRQALGINPPPRPSRAQ